MALNSLLAFFFLLNFHHFLTAKMISPGLENATSTTTYIVHVDPESGPTETWLHDFHAMNSSRPSIYHYRHVLSGFAARLSPADLKILQRKKGFISARPEGMFSLHTTRSNRFLGLNQSRGMWRSTTYGRGVIIGLIDTGVTPDHPSFDDKGMPPPPAKWKGKCELAPGVTCNNKLIGARYFDFDPIPGDDIGHGTHTASTAAGTFIEGASIYGNAEGRASGVAQRAHVAVYKACVGGGCLESDILRAMDTAIDDGVDVLSISLGGVSVPFYMESIAIAIASYQAVQRGIFVSCSAGNGGPYPRSLSNDAPWILTVGASTIDREIRATTELGNNQSLDGQTAFQTRDFPATPELPVIFPGKDDLKGNLRYCIGGFDASVKGKIVVCEYGGYIGRIEKGENVQKAGGAAMILMNTAVEGYTTLADAHVIPTSHISYADSILVKKYLNSTSSPTAKILFKGTILGDPLAPVVGCFSSRGPSTTTPGILKPDIIGPGINILAAWPISIEHKKNTKSTFNMITGTSMSCPHLSGVAALLKSSHPDWSPAAIKSAIMTTAYELNRNTTPIVDQRHLPADIFTVGAGHVNVPRAHDPGLVYDLHPDDYIPYLCGLNYTNENISVIVNRKVDCSKIQSIPEAQLNYPSFSIVLKSKPQSYTRTLTNVGERTSTYRLEIVAPDHVAVDVKPSKLIFTELGQKLSYTVTFTPSAATRFRVSNSTQGFISWNSAKHSVRSPVVVVFQ